jgi:hypothetical protein
MNPYAERKEPNAPAAAESADSLFFFSTSAGFSGLIENPVFFDFAALPL